ncbi:cytochrome ubiquinol oxidase subunit I [Crenobacter sp. SG2303]|uniref:Cytochrome ubiquinol oxidase subunit I n=1 Tax=Crenobacter oryzisoli TaxID=3056844 RepID=A0ABT7XQQ9_9NEIS|nr:cytochrome ubiquinol oxidase subunit I [Crenobacter sp. SG2303]MDN0076129.1 cytochrome ubiquinol oxidase subunit I [Crenobacter sp. SG2303]
MELDAITLARIQFGANITFHILFPTISIAMGWMLLFFKLRYNKTRDNAWMDAYGFWVKVFALTFALGVVSGITMSFQFGTNWPGYMQTVGNIAGPLLAYEVLTAFFLEATFLGIMLFGQKRVSNRVHTLATVLVAGGTTVSAFWIIALNSWMQTPAGFEMINGQAHVTNWLEVIFNPSMPYRLTHMLLASGLTIAFLISGVSAYRWLRGDRVPAVAKAMKSGVFLAALLIPVQIFVGDMHGLNTLHHQPEKIAAVEGVWNTEKGAPLTLFALPNEETRSNDYAITVPKLASLILTHSIDGELKGLNEFKGAHPPVAKVFWSFRVMVAMGMLMLATAWLAAWQLKKRGEPAAWLQRLLIAMTFSGWIATVAGWYVTEMGRQPWLVYGVLTTAQAASKVPAPMILTTLIMYLALYVVLLLSYVSVVFYLARKAGKPAARPSANLKEVTA